MTSFTKFLSLRVKSLRWHSAKSVSHTWHGQTSLSCLVSPCGGEFDGLNALHLSAFHLVAPVPYEGQPLTEGPLTERI